MGADYFIMFKGTGVEPVAFRDAYKRRNAAAWRSLPGVRQVLLHTPLPSHDPFLADKEPPLMLLQASFDSVAAAEAAMAAPARRQIADDFAGLPVREGRIQHEVLRTEAYPTATAKPVDRVAAAVSYFVHYTRPAEDEATFLSYYCSHHPPILGEFPDLRALVLYLPTPWQDRHKLTDPDHMLVCQVAFDSLEALNAALASDVRKKLRQDYHTFPPFSGPVTHYAMLRDQMIP